MAQDYKVQTKRNFCTHAAIAKDLRELRHAKHSYFIAVLDESSVKRVVKFEFDNLSEEF